MTAPFKPGDKVHVTLEDAVVHNAYATGTLSVFVDGVEHRIMTRCSGVTVRPAGLDSEPITILGFSVRVWNNLTREGIRTVDDLVKLDEQDVLDIRNFGSRSLREVIDKLGEHGLKLRNVGAPRPAEQVGDETVERAAALKPVVTRTFKGQRQDLYHFDNNFGAAVMHCNGTPGSDLIWFDVDVIRWDGATFRNVSGTPFASRALDVLDSLNESEVAETLAAIKALPVGGAK